MSNQNKRPSVAALSPEDAFVNTNPDFTGDGAGGQLLTPDVFAVWTSANAEELAAKVAASQSVRAAEKAARIESFTDATIRVVAASMSEGFTLNEACESLIGNAFRFGACHETMNELVVILESLGWQPEGAAC